MKQMINVYTSRLKGAGKKVCRALERVPRKRSGVPRGWMWSPLHFALEATTPDKVQQEIEEILQRQDETLSDRATAE